MPQTFAMGAGPQTTGSPTISPAVAYAMQQGVIPVDAKGLGKPLTYDPSKPDKTPSFQDWSDSIITTIDAQMPGSMRFWNGWCRLSRDRLWQRMM